MTTTVGRRALPRSHPRSAAGLHLGGLHLAVPDRLLAAAGGLAAGALLVFLAPLVAAIAALAVAAVGIGLSEAGRRDAAAVVLFGSLGMMLPALADLVAQMVRLL